MKSARRIRLGRGIFQPIQPRLQISYWIHVRIRTSALSDLTLRHPNSHQKNQITDFAYITFVDTTGATPVSLKQDEDLV
jgi:hypothetical protein